MIKISKKIIIAGTLLLAAVNVNAASKGAYAGIGVGISSLANDDVFNDTLENTSFKAFLGYQMNKNFAAEIGYSTFGDILDVAELSGLEASVIGMIPVTPRFSLYGRLGYWSWDVSATISNTTYSLIDGDDKFLGLGLQYNPSQKNQFRLEANRYDVEDSAGVLLDGTTVNLTYAFRF